MKRSRGICRRSSIAFFRFSTFFLPQPGSSASRSSFRQLEDVCGLADQSRLQQLRHLLAAEAFDVEGIPADEVAQAFGDLGGADQAAGAATDRLALRPHREAAADRAMVGEPVGLGALGPALEPDLDNLRDHVARPLHDHDVADPDVLALDVVLIVQRGARDHDAADGHGLEFGDRGQGAGAADLDADPADHGLRLLGRELVRDRPARRPADKAEPALVVDPVDLDHDAVDLVGQLEPAGRDPGVIVEQRRLVLDLLDQRVDLEPVAFEPFEKTAVGAIDRGLRLAPGIGEEAQFAPRSDRGIQLAQRARRRVARVGEQRLAGGRPRFIQRHEIGLLHVDLASHLEHRRRLGRVQMERNVPDRAQVPRDVLAD